MGKFRSKLKGTSKGKRWKKGHSSVSNPETKKHRDLAKSRFFQENLGPSNLTSEALKKHDAIQVLTPTKEQLPVSDMETEDTEIESSAATTYQTMDSFASGWSHCSNISFNRFLRIFRSDSALHKEMLAVLAAITEVIKENGGTESSTEYYCSLLTALDQVMSAEERNEDQITAILSLLNMGIKTVPEAVLRSTFDEVSKKMLYILGEFSNSENNAIIKSILGVLSALLRVQDLAIWSLSSTNQIFTSILNPFSLHTKPKWRKAAQQAVTVIVRTSCFVQENVPNPAADKVAEFCKEILDNCVTGTSNELSTNIKANQTTILHVLSLMKETIPHFSKTNLKKCCEVILQLMTLNYPLVTSCGLQVLYALFSYQTAVVPAKLNAQLISALYEYQPAMTDTRPMLGWLTVMQQAHIHLADVDLSLASTVLPKIFSSFTQLWLSEKVEIMSAVTHSLERLLRDAVSPICESDELVKQHEAKLEKCFAAIEQGLGYQYNTAWHHVLHVISIMFEIAGKHCSKLLLPCLKTLAELRDSYKFSYNNELEHAVGAAVRSMGPEVVLGVINLQKENGELNLDRSWLLPVLKENVKVSTIEFWFKSILPLAVMCQRRSTELSAKNDGINAHSYELLYFQLWNLLPSFCNKPTDIKTNFKNIAKILGTAISDHKDLRLSVMASLRKLITHAKATENPEDVAEIARFDKNYLPILFNVYTTKANGTDEEGQRLAALDTIKIFLSIAKREQTDQLFEHALDRLMQNSSDDSATKDSILDLIRTLVPYQQQPGLQKLYEQCIKTLPNIKNAKEQKKAYRLLEEICANDSECCKEFMKNNRKLIQKLLVKTLESAAISSKGARLRCLNYLIKAQPQLNHESTLLRSVIPEAVLACKDINEKCRAAAFNLLNTIGETLISHNELQQFITMLIAGFVGTPQVISATIIALTSVVHSFTGALGLDNIKFILENVGKLTATPTREIVGSCLSFIKTLCTSLPTTFISTLIPIIMKSLSDMTDDCKRHFRLKVRDILDRLIRKYGCDSITPHVPLSDTVMYKRLRNLRKLNARKKRRNELVENEKSDDADEFIVNAKPKTIEEILADSDSDTDQDLEANALKTNKKSRNTWIEEDEDTIVDFTDPKVVNKITTTNPSAVSVQNVQKKKKDGGFKTASDGRLIIEGDSSSDEDDSDKINLHMSDDSDSDNGASVSETVKLSNKKRKRGDTASVRSGLSGKSQPPMKYKAGGSGIHRPTSTSSVHSGFGSEYKAKKAGGDVRKKGKAEPYVYVPLKRNLLNKRKKTKMIGQFKSIGKAAKAGARKGANAKKKKIHK